MKATMTANDRQCAYAPGGAKDLRNAPRAWNALRGSAEPAQRGSPCESGPAARLPHGLLRNAAAALLALATLTLTVPAQAAVLISNDGQTAAPASAPVTNAWATSFSTGQNRDGYRLTNVQLRLGTPPATNYQHSNFKVAIWSLRDPLMFFVKFII